MRTPAWDTDADFRGDRVQALLFQVESDDGCADLACIHPQSTYVFQGHCTNTPFIVHCLLCQRQDVLVLPMQKCHPLKQGACACASGGAQLDSNAIANQDSLRVM